MWKGAKAFTQNGGLGRCPPKMFEATLNVCILVQLGPAEDDPLSSCSIIIRIQ